MKNNTQKTEKELIVAKIDNGIVIDHITPPGRAFYALKVLRIDEFFPHSVFLAMNVPSQKQGRKDVLKIHNMNKSELDLNKLGLVIAGSNVIYIKNFMVIEKEKIQIPNKITGMIKCPGPSCITNLPEDVQPEYEVINKKTPVLLRCSFCDKIFNVEENISRLL
ncbi:MAG: aspartate carbamoyltransferase regulatory subunit [Promethearchaeota archaeon]